MLATNDKQTKNATTRRKRKLVSLKESKAEQSNDFVLVPGASNWIALKKVSNIELYVWYVELVYLTSCNYFTQQKLGVDKPDNTVVGNVVDDHVTKPQITINDKSKLTVAKGVRRKCSSTKLRHKLQQPGQSVNETGLTNAPIPTKVLSRKRQRNRKTTDTNESLEPSKKKAMRLVLLILHMFTKLYVPANLTGYKWQKSITGSAYCYLVLLFCLLYCGIILEHCFVQVFTNKTRYL